MRMLNVLKGERIAHQTNRTTPADLTVAATAGKKGVRIGTGHPNTSDHMTP